MKAKLNKSLKEMVDGGSGESRIMKVHGPRGCGKTAFLRYCANINTGAIIESVSKNPFELNPLLSILM